MDKIIILKIISFILLIPSVGSIVLWLSGAINIIYLAIINWIIFIADSIIFLIILKHSNESNANLIIPKASCDEKTIPAETNIFSRYLIPTNPRRDCIFRVSLQLKDFKNPLIFSMIRMCEKDILIQELNKNIILDLEFIHKFEVNINRKEKLNFKFNKDVTIKSLLIEELYNT